MAQDFAKHRTPKKTGTRKSTRGVTRASENKQESHWSWFFSGLMSGLFAAFIAYLAVIRSEPANTEIADTIDAEVTTPDISRGEFEFYDRLPAAEVQVDVVQVADIARSDIVDDTHYMLQAGSFQDRQDAENRRATVILMNLDANVVPGIVAGKTWHRVQVGPFTGRRAAEEARDVLSSSNIDTIVLKLR